jgi:hypothetical protein
VELFKAIRYSHERQKVVIVKIRQEFGHGFPTQVAIFIKTRGGEVPEKFFNICEEVPQQLGDFLAPQDGMRYASEIELPGPETDVGSCADKEDQSILSAHECIVVTGRI